MTPSRQPLVISEDFDETVRSEASVNTSVDLIVKSDSGGNV